MLTMLQDGLKALESKVRNSLLRLNGVQVQFNQIEKRGGFYVAVYTVCVPITETEKEGEDQPS